MKLCIDDMLVKSKEDVDHDKHIEEIFNILRKFRMKLIINVSLWPSLEFL